MRLRPVLSAVALLTAAALSLTACESKIGQAALVDGHGISDSTVTSYTQRSGGDAQALAQITQQGGKVLPKVEVLSFLVQERLFTRLLQAHGGVPSAAQLKATHDQALTTILQSQTTGAAFDKQLDDQLVKIGFEKKMATLIIRTTELEYALAIKLHASSVTDLANEVTRQKVHVSVAKRYGKWDPKQLTIAETDGSGAPGFVTYATSSSAAAPAGQ